MDEPFYPQNHHECGDFFCWKLFLQQKSSWPSKFFTQLSMMNHLKTCRLFKALAFKSILDQDVLVGVLLVLAPLYLEPMGSGASLHVPEEVSQLIPEPPAKDAWQGRNFPSSFVFLRIPDLVKLEKSGWFYQFLLLKHMLRCMCRGVKLFCTKNVGVYFVFLRFSCKGTGRVHQ